ncbi:MAG: hypothetical protein JWQ89_665, partial [Devosia sp.]|nr:hypothetical protein [Devosia sp.]
AYATNYLIDTDNAIIIDVEASRAIRQAEVVWRGLLLRYFRFARFRCG